MKYTEFTHTYEIIPSTLWSAWANQPTHEAMNETEEERAAFEEAVNDINKIMNKAKGVV